MYDEKFFENEGKYEFGKINDKEEINKILKLYLEKYFNIEDDKQTWFDKMKDLAEEMGYAKEVKEYKQNPENWKGHVGDISTVLRVALTKRQQTPDLYEIMQVLGKENIEKRIKLLIKQENKMDYNIGDVVKTKKQHPCGSQLWEITRVGVDFKLKCLGCGHVVMLQREKALKAITKKIEKNI